MAHGQVYATWVDPVGSIIAPVYDSSVMAGTTGYSYRIDFTRSAGTSNSVILLPSSADGLDITGADTLSFKLRGDANASGAELGIGLKNNTLPQAESVVALKDHKTAGVPNGTFDEVRIPVSAFSGIDLTRVTHVQVWFQKGGGPTVTQTQSFSIWLDDIKFIDSIWPSTPTTVQVNGSALADGSIFNSTINFTCTAQSGGEAGTDKTLEEIRFEHDGLTGGATWYTVGIDTGLADTSYGYNWQATNLYPGTSYQLRISAVDVQGNQSSTTFFNVTINTRTPDAPGLQGVTVGTYSITAVLPANGNLPTTTVSITTGVYETEKSSSGIFGAGPAVLTLGSGSSPLIPNTTYAVLARAVSGILISTDSTVTAATCTLAATPGDVSFVSCSSRSATIQWGPNGNPLTPPTSYWVQIATSSDFVLYSSAVVYALQSSTDNLSLNSTYYFRVAAFNRFGSTSSFNNWISTQTGPSAPGVSEFAVYTTSIAVTLTPNGNFSGTVFTISTGAFEASSSSSAVLGTGSMTLSLTNLSTNTLYTVISSATRNTLISSATVVASTATLSLEPGVSTILSVIGTTVTIQWTANGNPMTPPTSYYVEISTWHGFTGTVTSSATFALECSTGGLMLNTSYFFRVQSFGRVGASSSAFNAVVSTRTGPVAPGVSEFRIFETSVSVTLTPNGNPAGTVVSISTGAFEASASSSGVIGAGNTTLSIEGLSVNTTYFVLANASRGSLVSPGTLAASTATLSVVPGASSISSVTGSTVTIQWTANGNPMTPPTSYYVEISTWHGFTGTVTSSATFALECSTGGLMLNTSYFFRVQSFCRVGASSSAFNAAVSTQTGPTSPGVREYQVFMTSVSVTLTPNGNAADTLVMISTGSFEASSSSSGVLGAGNAALSIEGLSVNTTYSIAARAFRGSVISSGTVVASTATLSDVPGAGSFVSVDGSTITIQWGTATNPLSPPTSYQVLISTWDNFTDVYSSSLTAALQASTNTALPNTTYYFTVASVNRTGSVSAYNASISTQTGPVAPGLREFSVYTTSISVTLTRNGNSVGSLMRISTGSFESSSSSAGISEAGASTTLSILGLSTNTAYTVQAQVLGVAPSSATLVCSTATLSVVPGASSVVSVLGSTITVQWDSGGNQLSPPTSYQVLISTWEGFEGTVTSSGTYLTQASTGGLSLNATYYFKVRSICRVGTSSSAFNDVISTRTGPASPGVREFRVFMTSVSVTLTPNGNTSDTVFTISTGAFETSNSSSGLLGSGASTTLSILGLSTNTLYTVVSSATRSMLISSATVVASTATLSEVPGASTILSVIGTTVTVQWTANSNPMTPPTSYYVEISTWHGFTGTVTSSATFALECSTGGLMVNTSYFFRVQSFGRVGASSSTFNDIISTRTGPTSPGVREFQVFMTSVSVTLAPNGNTSDTLVTVSTGAFEASSSSSGLLGSGASATLSVLGLSANTTYTVSARAAGVSASSVTQVCSTATLSDVPGAGSFVLVDGTTITVQWGSATNPLTPPTSYYVVVSTTNQGTSIVTFQTQASTYGVLPNTTYYFQVASFNRLGSTSAYNAVFSTLSAPAAPGVEWFTVSTNSVTVKLTLNGNSAGTGFQITTGSFETSSSSSGLADTLTLSNLSTNTLCTIRARAIGFSNAPSTAATVAASTATLPATPGAITFTSVSNNSITVSWNPNGNPLTLPTSYQVQISSNDPDFSAYSSSITSAVSLTTVTLSSNTTYYFRVLAFGVGGSSSVYNNAVSTRTASAPLTVPTAPSDFRISSMTDHSVRYVWTDNSDNEDGFRILNATGGVYGTASVNVTFFELYNLIPNSLVSARVAAYNSMGASTCTNSISSYTYAAVPGTPAVSAVTQTNLVLSWSANSNPNTTVYQVSRTTLTTSGSTSTGTIPIPSLTNLTATTCTLSDMTPGGTYYFRVAARNVDGSTSAYSAEISTVMVPAVVVVSTGGSVDAGATSVTADPGVTITNVTLPGGTTQQTLLSTGAATASYGNGLQVTLSGGVSADVVATADTLTLTSTQTVSIVQSGVTVDATSGTVSVQSTESSLIVSVTSSSPQNIQTTIPTEGLKTVSISLNPPSGEIKTQITPGALPSTVKLRIKLPDSFPTDVSGAEGLGIGLEITTDLNVQPVKPVPITCNYRASDAADRDHRRFTIARYDDSLSKWISFKTSVDPVSRQVRASTNHFSKFQVLSLTPALDVKSAFVYPNPLQLHKGQTEMVFESLTPNAGIKIYSLLGELVRVLSADAVGTARWDAKNSSGERVASGIYIASIEGAGSSEKRLKIAVEK